MRQRRRRCWCWGRGRRCYRRRRSWCNGYDCGRCGRCECARRCDNGLRRRHSGRRWRWRRHGCRRSHSRRNRSTASYSTTRCPGFHTGDTAGRDGACVGGGCGEAVVSAVFHLRHRKQGGLRGMLCIASGLCAGVGTTARRDLLCGRGCGTESLRRRDEGVDLAHVRQGRAAERQGE